MDQVSLDLQIIRKKIFFHKTEEKQKIMQPLRLEFTSQCIIFSLNNKLINFTLYTKNINFKKIFFRTLYVSNFALKKNLTGLFQEIQYSTLDRALNFAFITFTCFVKTLLIFIRKKIKEKLDENETFSYR